MVKKFLSLIAVIYCSISYASEHNRTFYTYADEQNTVKVARVVQTLHLSTSGIWYLKQSFNYVSGSGYIPTAYKCFNGFPYDPLINLTSSWINTDASLRGCKRVREEVMKQAESD